MKKEKNMKCLHLYQDRNSLLTLILATSFVVSFNALYISIFSKRESKRLQKWRDPSVLFHRANLYCIQEGTRMSFFLSIFFMYICIWLDVSYIAILWSF